MRFPQLPFPAPLAGRFPYPEPFCFVFQRLYFHPICHQILEISQYSLPPPSLLTHPLNFPLNQTSSRQVPWVPTTSLLSTGGKGTHFTVKNGSCHLLFKASCFLLIHEIRNNIPTLSCGPWLCLQPHLTPLYLACYIPCFLSPRGLCKHSPHI